MPLLTDEQIADARSVSLLEYMRKHEPHILKQEAAGRYVHVNHDSFVIDNGKGQWFWNSRTAGGNDTVDYLMKIEGMDFRSAVFSLTGGEYIPPSNKSSPQKPTNRPKSEDAKPFRLPKAGRSNTRVINYLQKRGIDKNTIYRCINRGLLYESDKGNCVFVGRDENNKPKYAAERSTQGDSKKDVAGSDKQYSFCLPPDKHNTFLAVFESPIDALSHKDLINAAGTEWEGYRLSLGGVSSKALDKFLEQNPEISHIWLCLDKDTAGHEASKRIISEILQDSRYADKKITVSVPPIGKDWGNSLEAVRQMQRDISQQKQATQEKSLPKKETFSI